MNGFVVRIAEETEEETPSIIIPDPLIQESRDVCVEGEMNHQHACVPPKFNWNPGTVDVLLKAISKHFERLCLRHERRSVVWKDIFNIVTEQVSDVTVTQCMIKWKNLKNSFAKYEESKRKTGISRLSEPVGYEMLCKLLRDKPMKDETAMNSSRTMSSGLPDVTPSSMNYFDHHSTLSAEAASAPGMICTPDLDNPESPATETCLSRSSTPEPLPKRRRLMPSSQSKRRDIVHAQLLEEAKETGSKFDRFLEMYLRIQRKFLENQTQFQNESLARQDRLIQLQEEMLQVEKSKLKVIAKKYGTEHE